MYLNNILVLLSFAPSQVIFTTPINFNPGYATGSNNIELLNQRYMLEQSICLQTENAQMYTLN